MLRSYWKPMAAIAAAFGALSPCHADWKAAPEWTVESPTALSAAARSQTEAWNTTKTLARSWAIASDVTMTPSGDANEGARILIGDRMGSAKMIVTISKLGSRNLNGLDVEYFDNEWHHVLRSRWIPGRDATFAVSIARSGNSISARLFGDQGLSFCEQSAPIPTAILDSLTSVGVAAINGTARFANFDIAGPLSEPGVPVTHAQTAMDGLIEHYWIGGPDTGSILPTYGGYPVAGQDPRGSMWERELMVFSMDTLYQATHDPILKRRLRAEWDWTKAKFSPEEMQAAGSQIHAGSDDTGWDALAYLVFYKDLGDPFALEMAKGLIDNGFKLWLSDDHDGGIWYNNDHKGKSLYGISIVYAAFQIYDATHDQSFYDRALASYNWIEGHLLRPDNIYWADAGANGPFGKERPGDIHEGGSVTFLAGNMGKAVVDAWLYNHTNEAVYLNRAIRTADAVAAVLTRDGVYLDDRDAWTNGTFFGEWASRVLTLPGMKPLHKKLLLDTANSIVERDQTLDGYLGGAWHGPADGPGSRWSTNGSRAQQLMTSGSTSIVLMAAALADAGAAAR